MSVTVLRSTGVSTPVAVTITMQRLRGIDWWMVSTSPLP